MQGDKRTKLLNKNILASFFIKGWSALIVFLMVPLTLKMLGIYQNGIWLTISSVLVWIDMMDIGLGNGLRNVLAKYMAIDDNEKAREAISSTLFMLVVIAIPVLALLLIWVYFGNPYQLLGVDRAKYSFIEQTLTVAIVFVVTSFVFKFIGNFYMGIQLPAVNNMLVTLGQTLALILTFIASLMGSHSLFVVVLINTASPLIVWLASYPYTFGYKYPQLKPAWRYVNFKAASSLCNIGIRFFVIQACSLILFMSSNLIISNMFSPAEVTPFQVAYRYFSIMLVIFTIICMPFWNATTDAYTRGDLMWIRMASRKLNYMMVGITIGMILMVVLANPIYKLWVGEGVKIPLSLSISMACYLWILIVSMRYSYFLNGIGALRIQLFFTTLAAAVFIPIAWYSCKTWGTVTSLVVVMCLVNLPGLIANVWYFNRIIPHK